MNKIANLEDTSLERIYYAQYNESTTKQFIGGETRLLQYIKPTLPIPAIIKLWINHEKYEIIIKASAIPGVEEVARAEAMLISP